MKKAFQTGVGILLFLCSIGAAGWYRLQQEQPAPRTHLQNLSTRLAAAPIRELTTSEVVLNRMGCWATSNHRDLLERATDAGPWAVLAVVPLGRAVTLARYAIRVAAGGMAINELIRAATIEDALLQEVTVVVPYGIDLERLTPDRITVTPEALVIRVPPPRPLGVPRIDLDRSPTLDRQTNGDPDRAEWPRLKQLAFEDVQASAAEWIASAGLENSLREQARSVVAEIVRTMLGPARRVQVRFDGEAREVRP